MIAKQTRVHFFFFKVFVGMVCPDIFWWFNVISSHQPIKRHVSWHFRAYMGIPHEFNFFNDQHFPSPKEKIHLGTLPELQLEQLDPWMRCENVKTHVKQQDQIWIFKISFVTVNGIVDKLVNLGLRKWLGAFWWLIWKQITVFHVSHANWPWLIGHIRILQRHKGSGF